MGAGRRCLWGLQAGLAHVKMQGEEWIARGEPGAARGAHMARIGADE